MKFKESKVAKIDIKKSNRRYLSPFKRFLILFLVINTKAPIRARNAT